MCANIRRIPPNLTAAFPTVKKFEPGFAERRQASNDAKRALLPKPRKASKDPNAAAQQQARLELAAAREARLAKRKADRRAEKSRKAEEKARIDAARLAAKEAEQARIAAEAAAAEAAKQVLAAEQKAQRDRRYAARKR
jgi:hypothetical protein